MLKTRDALKLQEKFGGFKFFSIDGCHQVTHTVRDIEFAMSVTLPEGIIAVDDYLNADWPGVGEAVAKMYLLHEYPFVPLLFTCNKLLLCSQSYHAQYLELVESYLQANFPKTHMKKVVRFGYDTLTVRPNMQEWHDLPAGA
jgi:hypothetical protein